jgi:hypothetical protein
VRPPRSPPVSANVLVRRADDGDHHADVGGVAVADHALAQHAGAARHQLHRRLVGLDLGEDVASLISSPSFLSQVLIRPSSMVGERASM